MSPALFPPGPYTLVGETIIAAPQSHPGEGNSIPGSFIGPSLADLRPLADPEQRGAVAELFRAAPEVLAQRDDLARRLAEAIIFIEHGVGERAGADDAAALRLLLDREVLRGLPLKAAYGSGANRSEASFDLKGAKAAVALAQQDPKAGRMASYAQLHEIVERLTSALDRSIEDHIDPREVIGSAEEQLVKEAYGLLNRPYQQRQDDSPRP